MPEHGLWFIRVGAEQGDLGQWEVWFRPLHSAERKHGNFPTRDQALEVVTALNEFSRRGHVARAQGDGDPGQTDTAPERA